MLASRVSHPTRHTCLCRKHPYQNSLSWLDSTDVNRFINKPMDCGAAVFCPVCSLCHCANFGKPKGLGCGGTKVFFRSPSVERMFDQSSGTRQLWKVSNTDTKLVMQCVCMFIFERCLWSSAKKVLTDVLLFDTFRRNKTEHAGIYIHTYIMYIYLEPELDLYFGTTHPKHGQTSYQNRGHVWVPGIYITCRCANRSKGRGVHAQDRQWS